MLARIGYQLKFRLALHFVYLQGLSRYGAPGSPENTNSKRQIHMHSKKKKKDYKTD